MSSALANSLKRIRPQEAGNPRRDGISPSRGFFAGPTPTGHRIPSRRRARLPISVALLLAGSAGPAVGANEHKALQVTDQQVGTGAVARDGREVAISYAGGLYDKSAPITTGTKSTADSIAASRQAPRLAGTTSSPAGTSGTCVSAADPPCSPHPDWPVVGDALANGCPHASLVFDIQPIAGR